MKKIILSLVVLSGVAWLLIKPPPVTFSFANSEWHFPSTIEEAVKKHDLSFKPPGYYYRVFPDGMEAELRYHSKWWELDNDNQPKETLYGKHIHTYYFRFPDSDAVYDSLRQSLEQQFNNKFKLKKGIRKEKNIREDLRSYAIDFLAVDSSFVVGLGRYKSMAERDKKFIAVSFLYNLSEDEQITIAAGPGD